MISRPRSLDFAVRDLARSYWITYDPDRYALAVFNTYYDTAGSESSTEAGDWLVTVGLIASIAQWELFERRWRAVLRFGAIPYFHGAERARLFAERLEEERRFKRLAIQVIRDSIEACVVSLVHLPSYTRTNQSHHVDEKFGSPFGMVAGTAAMQAELIFRGARDPDRWHALGHFHEKGKGERIGHAQRVARANLNIGLNTKPWEEPPGTYFRPLEAADLIAWEVRRVHVMEDRRSGGTSTKAIRQITRLLKKDINNWNAESFADLVAKRKIRPR